MVRELRGAVDRVVRAAEAIGAATSSRDLTAARDHVDRLRAAQAEADATLVGLEREQVPQGCLARMKLETARRRLAEVTSALAPTLTLLETSASEPAVEQEREEPAPDCFEILAGDARVRVRRAWLTGDDGPCAMRVLTDRMLEVLRGLRAAGRFAWASDVDLEMAACTFTRLPPEQSGRAVTLDLSVPLAHHTGLSASRVAYLACTGDGIEAVFRLEGATADQEGQFVALDESALATLAVALEQSIDVGPVRRDALARIAKRDPRALVRRGAARLALAETTCAELFGATAWERWRARQADPANTDYARRWLRASTGADARAADIDPELIGLMRESDRHPQRVAILDHIRQYLEAAPETAVTPAVLETLAHDAVEAALEGPEAPRGAWQNDANAMAARLGLGGVRVEDDGAAASMASARGARGVALGETVYLDLAQVVPGTEVGREILAHELIHVAQARLSTNLDAGRAVAEAEAAGLAPLVASGASVQPRRYIDLSRPAADRDAPTAEPYAPKDQGPARLPDAAPIPHASHEVTVAFGSGSITGAITGTFGLGPTGVGSVTEAQIKAFEATTVTQVNGFATRLETAVLGGEMELALFEGFAIAIEVKLLDGGLEVGGKHGLELDLAKLEVKVRGDASHWLPAGSGMTLTLDGVIGFSIGGKLAAKLASVLVAEQEQRLLARQVEAATQRLADSKRTYQELAGRRELLAGKGATAELAAVEAEIARHKGAIEDGVKQVRGLKDKLDDAARKMSGAVTKLKGKLAGAVASAMEKQAIRRTAAVLTKLIPILNLISTIVDVIDFIRIIAAIVGGESGGGGDGDEDADGSACSPAPANQDAGAASSMPTVADGPRVPEAERAAAQQARDQLSPAARAVLAASTGPDGVALRADQITLVGMMVPTDLTQEELIAVTGAIRTASPAHDPEAVIAAIDQAVRSVRVGAPTIAVAVDGVDRPDLAAGPVSEPSQVDGGGGAGGERGSVSIEDPAVVIRQFPMAIARRWFEVRDGELVTTPAFAQWKSEYQEREIQQIGTLESAVESIAELSSGWEVTMTFTVRSNDGSVQHPQYAFWVRERNGNLEFESFLLFEINP